MVEFSVWYHENEVIVTTLRYKRSIQNKERASPSRCTIGAKYDNIKLYCHGHFTTEKEACGNHHPSWG